MKEYTIDEIHQLMDKGDLTAVELVQMYLDRIDKIDTKGPKLNSIIELNPEALLIARKLDELFEQNGKTGPLHGIPVLIKDNIDTLDHMKTTAGSKTIEKHGGSPSKDAFVVKQLREAGAIILGKTNLSEMANFRGQRSVSGWSSRGGRTRNPYVLDRNPSGSSSGSGVAVAANLCTVAVGTETDGSIISPAQTNGIVGIKPSIGLISRSGIIPIAHSQDTAGPMTRTVKDAAKLLECMIGYDPEDEVTSAVKIIDTNYSENLSKDALKGARIGILRDKMGFHRDVEKVLEQAIDDLNDAGSELIDPVEMEYPEDWESQEFQVLLFEYKHGLNKYFPTRKESQIQSIEDLIRLNKEDEENTMPFFGQEHVESAADKGDLDEEEYVEAMQKYQIFQKNLSRLFEEHQLDAIFAPSGGPAWVTDFVNGDHYSGGGSSQLAAVSGYANITVPAGYVHGLPVGINFIGNQYSERRIIEFAYAFEQINPERRKKPDFLDTISA